MSPQDVLAFAQENGAKQLDMRFTDIPGLQHHISYPIAMLTEDTFEEGFGIDGASIRGWAAINESDMILIPDPQTAMMDPFYEVPTLVMTGMVKDPITRQSYERDPRHIAQKSEAYLRSTGLADTCFVGAEGEFFVFDNIRFDSTPNSGYYYIDAEEGRWNTGRESNNHGYRPRYKEGYFPVPPPTTTRTSAPKWSRSWSPAASSLNATTTKSPPVASAKSTSTTLPSSNPPTT